MDPTLLRSAIRTGCEAAIAAEPNLTQWDMVLGDGDCGEAVKGVSEGEFSLYAQTHTFDKYSDREPRAAILQILENGGADKGSVLEFLHTLLDAVDDMGGTLGAILGILLAAFTSALATSAEKSSDTSAAKFADALQEATAALKTHTSAREGDRTVMDVLLPFADAFAASKDFHSAVAVAKEKAEATRYLKARFGRATYVGEGKGQELPDPGAWAMFEWLNGMSVAIAASSST